MRTRTFGTGLFILILALAGCGGVNDDSQMCREADGNLSARDICHCIRGAFCARAAAACTNGEFDKRWPGGVQECEDATKVQSLCDQQSGAQTFGPKAAVACLEAIDKLSCGALMSPDTARESFSSCTF